MTPDPAKAPPERRAPRPWGRVALDAFETRRGKIRAGLEIADVGFLLLRVAAVGGNYAWLLLSHVPAGEAGAFISIIRYFIVYSLLLYLVLFLDFERKRTIYAISLAFDLSYIHFLVIRTGGFHSTFLIGFYLLTTLHSFYYGYRYGLLVAATCSLVLFLSGYPVSALDRIDFVLHASFFFLLAMPIGLFSGKLRADKEKIEYLNEELIRSIGEARRIQDKLIRAEKLSALGRLTAEVAHEIRNPLTVVGGFAKRLEKRLPDGEKEKEYAGIIVSEVGRLERILRDVLSFSREAKYHQRHTSLNGIVADTAQEYAGQCGKKSIRVNVEALRGLPTCVADEDQVRQAVNNLVQNAIDAMQSGGALTLRTRMTEENGVRFAVIEVADTGTGIPEEQSDRIFEPFYSRKEIGQGTGLGLSICKKIMEEHRGLIRLSSIPGNGSVFGLYFPCVPSEEAFEVQCWEYTRCGMDNAADPGRACAAYPNFGRICWSVAGTLSETPPQCVTARQIGDCRKCGFYATVEGSRNRGGTGSEGLAIAAVPPAPGPATRPT